MAGRWHSHSVGAGTLVSEEERPDNQHEVEEVRGNRGGSVTKGRNGGVVVMGGQYHKMINNDFF